MQIAPRIVKRPDVEGLHGPLVVSRRRAKAPIHHECVIAPIELQEEGEALGRERHLGGSRSVLDDAECPLEVEGQDTIEVGQLERDRLEVSERGERQESHENRIVFALDARHVLLAQAA